MAKSKDKSKRSAASEQRPVKVLLVEDEDSFVEALRIGLAREGFDVTVARDGAEGLEAFAKEVPDLILLDMMLPKISGLDVCRQIRTESTVPIIMVTAKSEEIDAVVALEVGADDYVIKPYRLRELTARMRAVMRRTPSGEGIEVVDDQPTERGGLRLEPETRRTFIRGEETHLRRKEFELLHLLMENAGRVLTRDVLIDRIWGSDYVGDTKTLDVHIKRLRSQVEEDPKVPKLITTIRGVGYRFDGN